MPVYEYRCNACQARLSIFSRTIATEIPDAHCDRCGSTDVRRLISRVAVIHAAVTEKDLNKGELLDGVNYTDPSSMANMFRKMGNMFQDEKNEYMDDILDRL